MAPSNLHTTHAPDVFNWVWDPATSEWVKETQSTGGGGGGGGDGAILDGVNPALKATVLAGSTGALFSDQPLVVASHPNSPLPSGTNTLGKVNQGTRGTVANGWYTSSHPFSAWPTFAENGGNVLAVVNDQITVAVEPGGSAIFLEVLGTHTGVALAFTAQTNGLPTPVLGVRTGTGIAESASTLVSNATASWVFFVPGFGTAGGGVAGAFSVTLTAISSGSITAYAAESARPQNPVGATTVIGTVPVSATSLPLPAGASTSALQTTGNTSLANLDVALSTRLKPADTLAAVTSITNPVTVVQGTAVGLRTAAENYQGGNAVGPANPLQVSLANTGANATAVKVDGSAVTQPVSGTFWQATQPVSVANGSNVAQGTTTDAAVISDTTGTTIGFLRGLVKIFASVWDSVNGALRTKAASITVTDTFANGAAAGFLTIDTTGMSVVNLLWVNVVGAFNGSGTTEGSPDGVNWVPAPGMMLTSTAGFHSVYLERLFYSGSDLYDLNVPVAQFKSFRLKIAGPATVGSASLCMRASAYAPPVYQPVARIAGANGDLAGVDASLRLSTVAAQGPSLNAPSAWYTQLTDTTNGPVAVKAASTAAVATDAALVVRTVQLPTALAASGGLKIEGVSGGVTVPVADSADVYTNDGAGPNYASTALAQHLTQTFDGRLRVIQDAQSRQALLQLDMLGRMLAVLQAMNMQLAAITGASVDPGDFSNDNVS